MDCYSLEIARMWLRLNIAYNFNETRDIIIRLGSAFHYPSIDIASMTCDLISIDAPCGGADDNWLALHRDGCCRCSREEIGDTCCGISGTKCRRCHTVSFPAERTIVARTPLLSCHASCLVPYLVYTRTFSFR